MDLISNVGSGYKVLNASSVNTVKPAGSVAFKSNDLEKNPENDELKLSKKELTDSEKKEIIRSARTDAAGWSIFGEVFSTVYYAVRSDKAVAKKYGLDPENDKSFIKNIKKEQVIATLPGVLVPSIGGIVSWAYNKFMNPENIDL